MVTTIGVRETVKNLNDLQTFFNLTQTEDDNFFTEWHEGLPEITELIVRLFSKQRNYLILLS